MLISHRWLIGLLQLEGYPYADASLPWLDVYGKQALQQVSWIGRSPCGSPVSAVIDRGGAVSAIDISARSAFPALASSYAELRLTLLPYY